MVSLEIYCMCLGEYIPIEHISSTKDATSRTSFLWKLILFDCLFV